MKLSPEREAAQRPESPGAPEGGACQVHPLKVREKNQERER